jgi:hypothetical protein
MYNKHYNFQNIVQKLNWQIPGKGFPKIRFISYGELFTQGNRQSGDYQESFQQADFPAKKINLQ